jgi:hypothetical protein
MKSPLAAALAAFLLVPSAAASDVCMEFLAQHPQDDKWLQECLDWLEQWEQPAPFPAASPEAAGSEGGDPAASSGTGTPRLEAPRHVGASNPAVAAFNQNEAFIAVDPSPVGGGRAFAISKTHPFVNGLFAAYSSDPTDPGTSWNAAKIAVGPGGAIPGARGDPWAVFNDYGELFISYIYEENISDPTFGIPAGVRPTIVAQSGDGGASFTFVQAIEPAGRTDRPSIAMGPGGSAAPNGSLWLIYKDQTIEDAGRIVVRGAALGANGDPTEDFCGVGTGFFCYAQIIAEDDPVAGIVTPGHVAVGPTGQVLATYTRLSNPPAPGPTRIFAVLDADGLGTAQGFPPATPPSTNPVLTTNVGFLDDIPPHTHRKILPLANLAWDHGSGRIYLVSTAEEPQQSDETDIVLLTSDDDGASWSAPKRVNDDPPVLGEVRSQFFPHVAVDQTTGNVAIGWQDPRNDEGGSDGTPNTETEAYLGISADGGETFLNVAAAHGFSKSTDVQTSHGDYQGVAFHGGTAYMAWADNSNSAGDNPDLDCTAGTARCMDIYVPEPGRALQQLAGVVALPAFGAMRSRS